MKKHWWKIILGCLVLFSIVGVLWKPETENAVELVVSPQKGPFRSTITTTGELQAKNSVRVNGPSRAQQMRIYEIKILNMVPEGTIVEKGDIVAELDPSELTNRIKDAEADLEVQQSEFTQAQLDTTLELSKARDALVDLQYAMEEAQIKKEQAIYESPSMKRQAQIESEKAERSYDRALVNYDMQVQQAAAKVRATRAELSKTQRQLDDLMSVSAEFTVVAPEKGMVIYRDSRGRRINDGSTINTWNPVVATLPDLSVMESKTFINEVDIQRVKTGQQVEVGLDAIPNKRLTGTVTQVANIGTQQPNSDAKVFEVTIQVNEVDSTLRPAMTTSNTIIVAELQDALRIPLESIHTQDSLNYVFVKDGVRIRRQEVQLGLLNENEAVVEDGLTREDRVFISLPPDTTGIRLDRLEASLALNGQ